VVASTGLSAPLQCNMIRSARVSRETRTVVPIAFPIGNRDVGQITLPLTNEGYRKKAADPKAGGSRSAHQVRIHRCSQGAGVGRDRSAAAMPSVLFAVTSRIEIKI
jgi:hypothetical protein